MTNWRALKNRLTCAPFVLSIFIIWSFFLYAGSINDPFLLDDNFQIVKNTSVHNLSQWLSYFSGSTMAIDGQNLGIYYKPVMTLFYGFLWYLGENRPLFFHLFQLLLHTMNAFLLFTFFRPYFSKENVYIPLFLGLTFLCHPINSEAVLMIADLQEPLFTFFGLVLLLSFSSLKPSLFSSVLSIVAALLCLLSKETGILYFFMCILFCALFQRDRLRAAVVCMLISFSAYLGLRFGIARLEFSSSDNMSIMRADISTRLLTLPKILIHYIQLFFFPNDISLTQDWVVKEATWTDFWLPLLGVILIVSTLIGNFVRKKSRIFLFFLLWFIGGWVAHSQIIPLDGTVSDRWFYFTIIGFSGAVFILFESYFPDFAVKTVLVFFVLALSFRTYIRTFDWRDAFTLFQHDIQIEPNSFYLNNNLGLEFLTRHLPEKAIPLFERTILVSPQRSYSWFVGWRNLGAGYLDLGNYKKAEDCFKIAVQDNDIRSFRALAMTLKAENRTADLKEYLNHVALAKYPNDDILLKLKNELRN